MISLLIFPAALLLVSLIVLGFPRLSLAIISAIVVTHLIRHGL